MNQNTPKRLPNGVCATTQTLNSNMSDTTWGSVAVIDHRLEEITAQWRNVKLSVLTNSKSQTLKRFLSEAWTLALDVSHRLWNHPVWGRRSPEETWLMNVSLSASVVATVKRIKKESGGGGGGGRGGTPQITSLRTSSSSSHSHSTISEMTKTK